MLGRVLVWMCAWAWACVSVCVYLGVCVFVCVGVYFGVCECREVLVSAYVFSHFCDTWMQSNSCKRKLNLTFHLQLLILKSSKDSC